MDIEIRPSIDKAVDALTDAEKKQIPFAMSLAMNRTAFAVRTAMQRAMPVYFDRPTQMTMDAVLYDKTTKRDASIVSRIFIRDAASKTALRAFLALCEARHPEPEKLRADLAERIGPTPTDQTLRFVRQAALMGALLGGPVLKPVKEM